MLGPLPQTKGFEGLQVMRLDFLDGAVLEKALKHGDDLKIRFGKSMVSWEEIRALNTDFELGFITDQCVSNYRRFSTAIRKRSSSTAQIFPATSSTNLQARTDLTLSERSLIFLPLENKPMSMTRQKQNFNKPTQRIVNRRHLSRKSPLLSSHRFSLQSRPSVAYSEKRTSLLGHGRVKPKGQRPGSTPRSGPGTPLLNGTRSPMPGTFEPIPQADLDAIRIPALHILAVGPASEHSLATKTRAPDEYITRTLAKIGRKTSGGKWALQDECFKELDVWEFPYVKEKHRIRAIQNAREAFARMRVDKHATEYKILLSPEERDKAEEQEREEREKARLAPTPKPSSVRSVNAEDRVQSPRILPVVERKLVDEKPPTAKKAATKGGSTISKIISGKKAPVKKPKGQIGRPPKAASTAGTAPKKTTASRAKPAQQKYKSAETIDDSDEEAMVSSKKRSSPSSAPHAVRKSVSPPERPSQAASMHRTTSKSSSVTASDTDSSRPLIKKRPPPGSAAPARAQSPAKRPRTGGSPMDKRSSTLSAHGSAKLPPKPMSSYYKEAPSIHHAVRSVSNSPPKPSPLGSSPPITASTSTGRLSNASSPALTPSFTRADSSTASQSPLDMVTTRSKHSNGSHRPISPLGRSNGGVKSTGHRKNLSVNGRSQHRPLTPSTPPEVRLLPGTLDLARKFKSDFERYKKLYNDCQREADPERRRDMVRRVVKWHGELEDQKAKIAASCRDMDLD